MYQLPSFFSLPFWVLQDLYGRLDEGILPAALQPATGIVLDRVSSLEVIQYEGVPYGWGFPQQTVFCKKNKIHTCIYIECFDFIVSIITIRWVIDSMLAWINFCLLDLLPTFHLASSFSYLLIKIWPLTCLHAFFCQSACLLLLTLSLNSSSLSLDLSVSMHSFAY